MTRQFLSPIGRAAVVMLALAVVLCLLLPMSGDGHAGMQLAMVCCFVLAVLLGLLFPARPQRALLIRTAPGSRLGLARPPTRSARSPDPVDLGVLLI